MALHECATLATHTKRTHLPNVTLLGNKTVRKMPAQLTSRSITRDLLFPMKGGSCLQAGFTGLAGRLGLRLDAGCIAAVRFARVCIFCLFLARAAPCNS